jgi:hypothetical protein
MCGAGCLASAPNLRLRIVRLAVFSAKNRRAKSCYGKQINLIRMLRALWLLNCRILSRPADPSPQAFWDTGQSKLLGLAAVANSVDCKRLCQCAFSRRWLLVSSQGRVVLKITVTDLPNEQRWSLQGQLVGQWALELQSTWREAHHIDDTRTCIVELIEVTSIDRNGEAVLAEIMSQGAEFIASDVYTKHLLRNLRSELKRRRMKGKQDGGGND